MVQLPENLSPNGACFSSRDGLNNAKHGVATEFGSGTKNEGDLLPLPAADPKTDTYAASV
jgi:hypothetical protein